MKTTSFSFLFALFIILSSASNAQDSTRRVIGISATIQTSQYGIMIPVWIGNHFSISPAIEFTWGESVGADYAVSLAPRYYFKTNKLAPYIGVRAGFASFVPAKENTTETSTTDWIAGIAFGAEYFFDKSFSIGVELQGNYAKSDNNSMRFGNPGGNNISFATMVTANVYFLRKKK